jgi:DNA polymerase-1
MKLLIDGDWLCYSVACAMETKNPFDEKAEPIFNLGLGRKIIFFKIENYVARLDADEVEVHFSCKREDNWRRDLVPSYKMNRAGKTPPVGLLSLMAYTKSIYPYFSEAKLEADDTIGIASTSQKDVCIVSVDKDFLTIPTNIYNPQKDILKKQSRLNAFKSFIYQVIIGDSSDGFKGIPKAGPKKALAFIAEHSKSIINIWEPLVKLAEKHKVDEEYLLTQARMAHILQAGDYDFETKAVKLWEASMIPQMLA